MPKAKAKPASGEPPLPQLPTAEESAAAVRRATKRLGLLIDLHRVAERLRQLDREKSIPRSC
jgi:hypothetical protein